MTRFEGEIIVNREISPAWNLLGFAWPPGKAPPLPGQFFTFLPRGVEYGESALLRRPLAFAWHDGIAAYSIFQAKGPGTKSLARRRVGESIDVIAPLGNSFPDPDSGERSVLAGGGIGIGPMLFLAARLKEAGRDFTLHLGFRTKSQVPEIGLDALDREVSRAKLATDDGSLGFQGTVIQAVARDKDASCADAHLFACGPKPMLAAAAALADEWNAQAHVSVEQWMACGVGACHGCVVPAAGGGYLRACADGPVFSSRDLSWEK
ncbi:MAG: dihydroorotate dehydrogenase electron transfer subunit [Spirochaetota bacterium]